MKKIGFIDNYLDEWHANNYPAKIHELSGGEMVVTYAYARQDAPNGMTTDEWCEKNNVERVDSIEELVEKSDYVIVLSPDHPEHHEELCQIPLSSGKRCYVDKTFAVDTATAKRIFAVANEHNTPVFSSSALRFADEVMAMNVPADEIDHMTVISNGPTEIYLIHMIEPMVKMMGANAQRIMFVGTEHSPSWVVEFEGGRKVNMTLYHNAHSWYFRIHKKDGEVLVIPEVWNFFDNFLAELVDFFKTGDVKVEQAQTVAVIEIRSKALESMNEPGVWYSIDC